MVLPDITSIKEQLIRDIIKKKRKVREDIFVARVKQMNYAEVAVQLSLFHDELTAHLERKGLIPEEEYLISLQTSYSLFNSIQDIFWHKIPLLELRKLNDESIDPNTQMYFSHIIAMRTQS